MSLQRSYLDLPFLVSLVELPARAAEIKLLCAVALHPAIDVLIPDFENSSGHKVTVAYGNEGAIADRFQKGEAADLLINAAPLMDQLRAQGKVVAGDHIIIAKVGVSAFVRKGAAKPYISSADAFKRSMLAASRLLIRIQPVGVPVSAIQNYTEFVPGIVTGSNQTDAARALVTSLTSPAAQTVLKAKGFE